MTLNRMYHCVPRIISGLSQMSGSSRNATIAETAIGNSRLAGKAARNCATGCTIARERGPQADPDADRHPDQAGDARSARARAPWWRGRARRPSPTSRERHARDDEARDLPERAARRARRRRPSQSRSSQPSAAVGARGLRRTLRRGRQRADTTARHGRAERARSAQSTSRDRRSTSSTQERGGATPASCSKRNRSAQATSGRNSSWS